jgi:hypothetical protein
MENQPMMRSSSTTRSTLFVVAIAVSIVLAAPAAAKKFYSMDIRYDSLVEIDTDAGTATQLGWVGFPVVAAAATSFSMELADGPVYWTNFAPDGPPLWLAHVDPMTLTLGGALEYTLGGSTIEGRVEDLSWDGTTLVAALGLGPSSPRPRSLADVSAAGEVSNIVDFSSFGVYLDRLAISPSGEIIALERGYSDPSQKGILYRLERPAGLTVIGEVPHLTGSTAIPFLGMDFDADGNLWILEEVEATSTQRSLSLRRVETANAAVLEEIPIVYTFMGLSTGLLLDLTYVAEGPVQNLDSSWGRLKGLYRALRRP